MATLAGKRLHEIVGEGSPEIAPRALLVKDAELLVGAMSGAKINKYGIVLGLDYGMKALGDAIKSPTLKEYAPLIARGISLAGSLIALLMLRGKWSRMFAFGAIFENVEAGIDTVVDAISKAVGSPK
jgi:hypothetical protein